MGGIGHGGRVLLVLHGSFRRFFVYCNVIKPCQSLYIEGGGLRHFGFEVVGRITIRDGGHRRDHYTGRYTIQGRRDILLP